MTSPFARVPSAEEMKQNKGPFVPWARCKGRLIVVRPLEYQKEGFVTTNAPDGTDAVFADVAVLDAIPPAVNEYGDEIPGFDAGTQFRGQVVLAGYLKGTFKRLLGQTLIGTITIGVPTKGRPPLHFQDLSADATAVARGTQFLQQHPEFLKPVTPEFTPAAAVPEVMGGPKPSYRGQPAPQQAQVAPQMSTLEDMRAAAASGFSEEPPY